MRGVDLAGASWRKSRYSTGGENENCVEAAFVAAAVAVRDSKNPDGPVLVVPGAGWESFLAVVVP